MRVKLLACALRRRHRRWRCRQSVADVRDVSTDDALAAQLKQATRCCRLRLATSLRRIAFASGIGDGTIVSWGGGCVIDQILKRGASPPPHRVSPVTRLSSLLLKLHHDWPKVVGTDRPRGWKAASRCGAPAKKRGEFVSVVVYSIRIRCRRIVCWRCG